MDNHNDMQYHRLPPTVCKQMWALIRRYGISLIHRPIACAINNVLWPMTVLGFCTYLLVNVHEEFATTYAASFVPFIVQIITIFILYSYADWMVKDRASGVKSLMISMGLRRSSYYLANSLCMLSALLPITLSSALISVLLVIKDTQAHAITVVMLFFISTAHLIGLNHAITSFITSSSWTAVVPAILFFTSLPQSLIMTAVLNHENWQALFMMLGLALPYGPINVFFQSYQLNKNNGTMDFNWDSRIFAAPSYFIICGSLFWTALFFIFSRWFEEVCPWQKDSAVRGPCFCFDSKKQIADVDEAILPLELKGKFFEQHYGNGEVGIRVRALVKKFQNVPAINGLSLDVYKGETTLLLGHNGAGKSTLMNLILGLLSPTEGHVSIKGYSKLGRGGIGVCPQTSILDDELTVRQHFELFVDLKSSMSDAERKLHIEQTLREVNLTNHADKKPPELSGGMKRKLSLGLAFIGHSSVLILDEPSSGLDPDSRVFIWNAIRRCRADRTVLLSTQHMEEADYLGDRVAIMSAGQIVCCGSSGFLNKIFGTGYKLRVECYRSRRDSILCHIVKYFEQAVPSDTAADFQSDAGSTDSVIDFVLELQTTKDSEKMMIELLENLENEGQKLGVISYGLKSSSIEDVMLNTVKYFANESNHRVGVNASESNITTMVSTSSHNYEMSVGRQLYALIVKIFLVHYNSWISFVVFHLLIPASVALHIVKSLQVGQSNGRNVFLMLFFARAIQNPVVERVNKFKTIQLTTQLSIWTYWLAYFISDLILTLIMLVLLNIFLVGFLPSQTIVLKDLHLILSLTFLMFNVSGLAFAYLMSLIMRNSGSALSYFYLINSFGLLAMVLGKIIEMSLSSRKLSTLAIYAGMTFLPGDAFNYIINSLHSEGYITSLISIGPSYEVMDYNMVYGIVALAFQIVLYMSLLAAAERSNIDLTYYTSFYNLFRTCFGKTEPSKTYEKDRDVEEESNTALTAIKQLDQAPASPFSLIAVQLEKSYFKGNKVIQDLSFTVKPGECFGLLGINGAGKTTTFSMLAAEIKPDAGTIWANGRYAQGDIDAYRRQMGYDPQSSPDLLLTPNQAMCLMARLRGIPERNIPILVDSVFGLLDMYQHKDKITRKLSGGTQRKLGLGMSLIATPRLMVLDEPTAGVDPLARRDIWLLLKSLRRHKNVSIVISSHAMEECEAICDRISIMARGQLRCIGTFLHLRSKFARGCTLRVQIDASRFLSVDLNSSSGTTVLGSDDGLQQINKVASELQHQLTLAIGESVFKLVDKNVNSATFNITDNRVRRSILFRTMREFRLKYSKLNLFYTLNDASLEDIFISLAQEQSESS